MQRNQGFSVRVQPTAKLRPSGGQCLVGDFQGGFFTPPVSVRRQQPGGDQFVNYRVQLARRIQLATRDAASGIGNSVVAGGRKS